MLDGCRLTYLTDKIHFKHHESYLSTVPFLSLIFRFYFSFSFIIIIIIIIIIFFAFFSLGLFILVLGFVICNLPWMRKEGNRDCGHLLKMTTKCILRTMGYSRRIQTGGMGEEEEVVEEMEFSGVLGRKNMWKFQVLIKKEMQFPGVFSKRSSGMSWVVIRKMFVCIINPSVSNKLFKFPRIFRWRSKFF